jgi:hypothetical protein
MLRSPSLPALVQRGILALTFLILAAPGTVQAQEVPDPDRERLTVYAQAFTDIAEVRERAFAELARTHDPEGKERVRHAFDEEIDAVLERLGMSSEEYEEITFLVSADAAYEAAFREALAQVRDGTPD